MRSSRLVGNAMMPLSSEAIRKECQWAVILCVLLVLAYCFMLFLYGRNVPLWDDYYDILYFLHTYLQADSLGGKIASLFWQFTEHRNPAGRLFYLGDYYLFGELNFFRMCVVGVVLLVMLAWLVGHLLERRALSGIGGITSVQVIPYALLLSMGMWQGTFWAMNAISVILYAVMSLAVFLLLKQKTRKALAWAMVTTAVLLTMGLIGFIALLFAVFYGLASDRPSQQKKIWLAFSLLASTVFLVSYADYPQLLEYSRADTLREIVKKPVNFLLTTFAFVGGLPFADGDSLWPGALLGVLLIMASGQVLHRYWRVDRQHFYLLFSLFGFLYTLMFAACVGRFLFMGEYIAYAPRFKQYPAIITSLILISYMQLYPRRWVRRGIVLLALSLTVTGYCRFVPEVVRQSDEIEEKITRWSAEGTYESLGIIGVAPHAEQILFWAHDKGLYDPYRVERAIRHRHRAPLLLPQCPAQPAASLDAFVLNRPYSLGARVMLHGPDDALHIRTLYLCGTQANYQLDAADPGSELSIQTSVLAPGDYRLFFTTADGERRAINQHLVVPPQRAQAPCSTEKRGQTVTFSLEVQRAFCGQAS